MSQPEPALKKIASVRMASVIQSMQIVAKTKNVSTTKQLREMIGLRYGPGKLAPHEYYRFRAYDPTLSRDKKRAFVGANAGRALNQSLSASANYASSYVLDDKGVFLSLMAATGLPVTHTQAFFSKTRLIDRWLQLHSADEISTFLKTKARYPIYGKPSDGSHSLGSILIEGIDSDGTLRLLHNAPGPHVDALAAEIAANFATGYFFQDRHVLSKNARQLCPDAFGSLRVVTILGEDNRPELLYSIWRAPEAGAYTELAKGKWMLRCLIDPASSKIVRATLSGGVTLQELDTHPTTNTRIPGFHIEQFPDSVALALRAHRVLPHLGLIGWDIGMTEAGPVLIEGNPTPFHSIYQLSAFQGLMNPDFAPRLLRLQQQAQAANLLEKNRKAAADSGLYKEMIALERGKLKT